MDNSTAGLSLPATSSSVPASSSATSITDPGDISSPAELTQWVDDLLNGLESRFNDLSQDTLTRLDDLGRRINDLDRNIQDLVSTNSNPDQSATN